MVAESLLLGNYVMFFLNKGGKMNMKKALNICAVLVTGTFLCAAVAFGAQQRPEVVEMNHAVFGKKTKPNPKFPHKKHGDAKPGGYGIACTECHHRYEGGKNLWKEGDEVKKCDTCHTGGKPADGEKLDKKEQIKKYFHTAIHEACVTCHKELKKKNEKAGPTACPECHKK